MTFCFHTTRSLPSTAPFCVHSLRRKPRRHQLKVQCTSKEVSLLDYGAGNVRSVRNAIKKLGFSIKDVERPRDIAAAERLIFPGVGSFGSAMEVLQQRHLTQPLKDYIQSGRPFFGICLGLQLLFAGSEENGGCEGLDVIPGQVVRFDPAHGLPIPHIGWNTIHQMKDDSVITSISQDRVYFVHSYHATLEDDDPWLLAVTEYGDRFVSAIGRGMVYATQFHPEKSGKTGLKLMKSFLELDPTSISTSMTSTSFHGASGGESRNGVNGLAKRVIACLDVRTNDDGDLVVTKGDQYDVREEGNVRNLGQPVSLAERYFHEGADEITFLNITGFRDFPLADLPMLDVLEHTSEGVFVPLTVGGGIRGFTDANAVTYSALEVASAYFRAGADKISIGSDAVYTVEEYLSSDVKTGQSSIEQISKVYGAQAVVVSIDPKRVWVMDPDECTHACTESSKEGDHGVSKSVFFVKGGRETRDVSAVELAKAVEELGAGEILLNCIDNDGQKKGFDLDLIEAVSSSVHIPVIASSGAGVPYHFTEVFDKTDASAALAAGIFHRHEVSIASVKSDMMHHGLKIRSI